ncbi:MAG: ribonuclease HII [Minisyncoccia bacterium]
MDLKTEKYHWKKGITIIGIDEAGRGPLAGPVVASSVMINPEIQTKLLVTKNNNFKTLLKLTKDSKKLSAQQREKIFKLIKKIPEIKFTYTFINEKIIDQINIEQATFLAMKKSIQELEKKYKLKANLILIDGNRKIPKLNIKQKTIVKGDNKVFSIALASIIAKVLRDKKMLALSKKYPQYHFEIHKGYPTKLHLLLLKKYGPCKIHRKSYKPVQIIIQKLKTKI